MTIANHTQYTVALPCTHVNLFPVDLNLKIYVITFGQYYVLLRKDTIPLNIPVIATYAYPSDEIYIHSI